MILVVQMMKGSEMKDSDAGDLSWKLTRGQWIEE